MTQRPRAKLTKKSKSHYNIPYLNDPQTALGTCEVGFIPLNDAHDESMTCIESPPGVQPPSDQPTEAGVELVTNTILSFEGGMTTFDNAANLGKFEAAVVAAMASSPDGLVGVQCEVSAVTASGSDRRLALSLHDDDAPTASTTLSALLTTPPAATPHRTLAAEQITIQYVITVPVADNAALGDSSVVRAATLATYDAAASSTGGAGVTTFASALAAPNALGSDVDQSTISSLDSSSADFAQGVKQVPSNKDPLYFVKLDPGMWRGAGDRIDGLRQCKNTAGAWLDACVGGSVFGEYCAPGHTGPLCALCEKDHFKDDAAMCKACPSTGIPFETFATPFFILAYCTCALALVGMVRACVRACVCMCE